MTQLPLCFTADTPGTTRHAARPSDTHAAEHRHVLLALYASGACLTADEAGARVGLTPLQARPRISELARTFGRLEPTGERRPTAAGNLATVWRIRP